MGVNGRGRKSGGWGTGVMTSLAALALCACTGSGTQATAYAALTCQDSLPSTETGPYRPGVVCLSYGESPTTGARSGAAQPPSMKAISVDGRVFFVDARRDMPPEALLHR